MIEAIVRIVGGLLGVFLGRRLFWLFAAVTGFLVGYNLIYTIPFMTGWADWTRIVMGIALGLVLAGLAAGLIRLAGELVGFAIGWQFATWLLLQFGLSPGQTFTIWSVMIGVICALLVLFFFDWGIIFLSSIYGAWSFVLGLAHFVNLGSAAPWIILIVLSLIGLFAQGSQLNGSRR
jgi:hypothetical protein